MKGDQNLPNRQVTSNNVTGKPLPFSHLSRSNSREHRNNSRHRGPNKFSETNSKPYYGNSNFKPLNRNGSPYPRSNFQKIILTKILDHNHLIIIVTEIVHDNRSPKINFVILEIIKIHF